MKCLFISFSFLLLSVVTSPNLLAQNNPNYTHKRFGTYFEVFENQNDLMKFLDISNGDKIADVGSGDTEFAQAITLLYDSITLYTEDIPSKYFNEKKFNKYKKRSTKLKGGSQKCQVYYCPGTYTSTNLPDNTFDKINLLASFHEFSSMDTMICDLSKKLKKNGNLNIIEAFSLKGNTIYCGDHHRGYRIQEIDTIMEKQGLYRVKMKGPEGNIVGYPNALCYQKNISLSKKFFHNKNLVEPLINKTRQFNDSNVVSNSNRMLQITDSITVNIVQINFVYTAFERYLLDIGHMWSKKKNHNAEINIYKMAATLYPESISCFSHLAEAYEKNKQYDKALEFYQRLYALDTKNKFAGSKIKQLKDR